MLFFAATIIAIVLLTRRSERRTKRARAALASICAATILGILTPHGRAEAAHYVYSPNVEEGEYAIELRGHYDRDSDSEKNRSQQYKGEFEHAPTAWWLTALVGEFEQEGDGALKTTAVEWENIFQLTDQGRHWMDVGVLTELSHELGDNAHDKLELGALLEKSVGRHTTTINLIAEHELGGESTTEISYAARWRLRKAPRFEPTLEVYGELGDIDHLGAFSEQRHSAGPGFSGVALLGGRSKLRYEAAYLFGVSAAAPNGTLRARVEYEF